MTNTREIKTCSLPKHSVLYHTHFEYTDSFQGSFVDHENKITVTDIGKYFFTSAPKWSEHLIELRNRLVSIFGLKTSRKPKNREAMLKNFTCEPNDKIGLFTVFHKDENEVVLGEDDKHLNFRISLYKAESLRGKDTKSLTISTTVKFHNWLGRLYFMPVKPFHRLIVPRMLKGILKQME